MDILILCYGTRGDIQPYIALGKEFQSRGNAVTLAGPINFESFITSFGLNFYGLPGDTKAFVTQPEGQKVIRTGNTFAFIKAIVNYLGTFKIELENEIMACCKGRDLIIGTNLLVLKTAVAAEFYQTPFSIVFINTPNAPTTQYPPPELNIPNWGWGWLNRKLYFLLADVSWSLMKSDINGFRIRFGLSKQKHNLIYQLKTQKVPIAFGFSTYVFPQGKDYPANIRTTGYLYLKKEWRNEMGHEGLSQPLVEWLEVNKSKKKVFVGMGSIPVPDPKMICNDLETIASKSNIVFVIGKGWSAYDKSWSSNQVFIYNEPVNHDQLFPLMDAIIHHGGAGTTSAALRAGKPQAVAYIFADQPLWGKQIKAIDAGTYFPLKKWNKSLVKNTLKELLSTEIISHCKKLALKVESENGPKQAADWVEKGIVLQNL